VDQVFSTDSAFLALRPGQSHPPSLDFQDRPSPSSSPSHAGPSGPSSLFHTSFLIPIGIAFVVVCCLSFIIIFIIHICRGQKKKEPEEKEEKATDAQIQQEHPLQAKDSKSPHVSKTTSVFGRAGLFFSRPKTLHPAWAAISVQQLEELRNRAKEKLGESYGSANMHDVNREVIQPMCDSHGKCYAHIVNSSEHLKVDVFISHAWLENFDEFVESILTAFSMWTVQPNIWICATALIQSTDPSVVGLQVGASNDPGNAPFTKALAEAQKVLIVRNNVCDIYDRIWCCWELYCASALGHTSRPGALMVAGPSHHSSDQVVDVALAKASCLSDKRKILTKIWETEEGYDNINRVLTQVKSFGANAVTQQV